MGDPPYARPAVAAGERGGFKGLSGRRSTDNDAGVHHNIHAAVTVVTAATVTADTAATVTAVTNATVTAFTSIAGSVTAVSVAVLGAAAGVWPYPLEDDPVFRHADDAHLGNDGGAASLVAYEKRLGFRSQRWPPVHDGPDGDTVDAEYAWSGGCLPSQGVARHGGPRWRSHGEDNGQLTPAVENRSGVIYGEGRGEEPSAGTSGGYLGL